MFPLESVPYGDPFPVTQDINKIDFQHASDLNIYDLSTKRLLGTTKSLKFDFSKSTFAIGSGSLSLRPLWIVPADAQPTTLHWDRGKPVEVGIRLRGGFVVKRTNFSLLDTAWSVTNVVNLEEYLFSVVPSEVIHSWDREAFRAQAIAARTYGLFEAAAARFQEREWDMDPSTWYQSYRGVAFYSPSSKKWLQLEIAATTEAVQATAGYVMLHEGEIIKAYFSANSGGRTCTVPECFQLEENPAYLREVNDAPGIQDVAGGTWGSKANLTPAAIKEKLVAMGRAPQSEVKRLEALTRGPSGRTWQLRVILRDGSAMELSAAESRKIMSLYGAIRSYFYELAPQMEGGKQGIVGHGYGHGVGMSQWGAQLFALQGWDAHRILEYFYSRIKIRKLVD